MFVPSNFTSDKSNRIKYWATGDPELGPRRFERLLGSDRQGTGSALDSESGSRCDKQTNCSPSAPSPA